MSENRLKQSGKFDHIIFSLKLHCGLNKSLQVRNFELEVLKQIILVIVKTNKKNKQTKNKPF